MDITSVEFYTLAFVLAMALIALLIGRNEKSLPSTYIVQLPTAPDEEGKEDVLSIEVVEDGKVRFSRTGLTLGPEETINLVFTIRDDHCSIVEKKGRKRRGATGVPVTGEVTVKCLRSGIKYWMRYESQVTSKWASFTFDTTSPQPKNIELRY